MKILIVSLLLLLGASSPATSQIFGKRRSDVKIDSLTVANRILAFKADSLSKEVKKYFGVYTVIKDKLIHYNFNPVKISYLIDSLKTTKDSITMPLSLRPKSAGSNDSIMMLLKSNSALKANLDSIKSAWTRSKTALPIDEVERAKAIGNLKQIKELLDAKIISDAEFLSLKQKYLNNL
jgi:hypothetical protein